MKTGSPPSSPPLAATPAHLSTHAPPTHSQRPRDPPAARLGRPPSPTAALLSQTATAKQNGRPPIFFHLTLVASLPATIYLTLDAPQVAHTELSRLCAATLLHLRSPTRGLSTRHRVLSLATPALCKTPQTTRLGVPPPQTSPGPLEPPTDRGIDILCSCYLKQVESPQLALPDKATPTAAAATSAPASTWYAPHLTPGLAP
ncbi:hypothetical protein FS749_001836 [Ceratobasidium sp. UAMH 11750]|nr:hypothetical protein FS749_001836 [Ceratobasidium sp. UAMH 11750]